jgi:chromosome segregation ATPase
VATKKQAPLTPAEIKVRLKDLSTAMKLVDTNLKPFQQAVTEAQRAQSKAKKDADKAIALAQKAVDAAIAKHAKAFDAAAKGRTKIQAQIDALAPANTAVAAA